MVARRMTIKARGQDENAWWAVGCRVVVLHLFLYRGYRGKIPAQHQTAHHSRPHTDNSRSIRQ